MAVDKLFGGAFPVLERALDLRSMKHSLIVSNIANKDTPKYKAFDLMVEDEMEKFMENGSPTRLVRTDDGHLPGREGDASSPHFVKEQGSRSSFRADGNSVDIDREMAKLSKNSLLYRAISQLISTKFQGLKDVISGGR